MEKPIPPYLGAAYYPEVWPLEQIDDDIALMKEAGLNLVRVGEFAWSRMEPEEGHYDFGWLHLAVEKLGRAGIAVIMCTPTCTPPVWLPERHREILFHTQDGKTIGHGGRRHACPNSPVYRDYVRRIVTRLAEEFGRDERIIGWQIDNEVFPWGSPPRSCVCPVCVGKFHEAMRAKYGTIGGLNAAWGTGLWSQTYQKFEQLPTPQTAVWHHPSLLGAWAEFNSDSYVDFVKDQAEILHQLTRHPIGTDMMPFHHIDYADMERALDIVEFNHYNTMADLWQAAFWFDFLRPIKERPFWNTETQTCWNGSVAANGYKEPGFCRANSWLPIALGGEANLYWLWRQHWSGQELMHGAVVSSCGRPLHIMGEVREIARGFEAAGDFLRQTRPAPSGLALIWSQRANRMSDEQPIVNRFNHHQAMMEQVYHPLVQAQLRPDIIMPPADLSGYRMIFSPFLLALDEAGLRARLQGWIEEGGIWIAGPLTDVRTPDGAKFTHAPFGCLEEWGGVICRHEIPCDPRNFGIAWADGRLSESSVWADGLELNGAEALATYHEGPNKGLAAATRRGMGKGQIILLGTLPQRRDLQALLIHLGREAGVAPVAAASENLIVVPRTGPGGSGIIVVEIENRPATLKLAGRRRDLLTGREHEGTMELEPYAVAVLKDVSISA